MQPQTEPLVYRWWSLLEAREVTNKFISESHDQAKEFFCEGDEHFSLETLQANGMKKIIKLSRNLAQIKGATFDSLGTNEICTILGDKQKLPVFDPLDPVIKKKNNLFAARDWKAYWALSPQERDGALTVLGFEYSKTALSNIVSAPALVSQLDWVSNLWPLEFRTPGEHPQMAQHLNIFAAGSFTHFHIESGGASQWLNLTQGELIILLIPPNEKNFQSFKDWISKRAADEKAAAKSSNEKRKPAFFASQVDLTFKCILKAGQSLIIPGGWAVASYASKDSILFSGKFLHGYNFDIQLKVHADLDEKCPERAKCRFLFFEELMWYVAENYANVRLPDKSLVLCPAELGGLSELAKFLKFYKIKRPSTIYSAQFLCDSINNYLTGQELPQRQTYEPDEEEDSVSGGNEECVECKGKVESNLWVGCEKCGNWYHAPCVGVSKRELEDLNNSASDYVCPRCLPRTESPEEVTDFSNGEYVKKRKLDGEEDFAKKKSKK